MALQQLTVPLVLALFAASSTAPLGAQAASSDGAEIDRRAAAKLREHGVGLSVAVAHRGELVHARGYGRRAWPDGAAVGVTTPFAIGSVTKQFTCACILLLAERGALSPKDPVADYFPDLTRAADITLLDLMGHTSGYPDYYPLDFVDRRMSEPIAPDELLRRYAGGDLDFEPGTRWSYSNTGYILLGRVVEKVSGRPFGDFLREEILEPLGLEHTAYEPGPDLAGAARGYTSFALGPPEPCRPEAEGWIGAAGGIWSTPSDLVRWALALMDGKVLKPASLELMTRPRELRGGALTGYGCGLSLGMADGRPTWGHGGAVDGFAAALVMVPATRSAVVVLANTSGGVGSLPQELLAVVSGESPPAVPKVRGRPVAETVRAVFEALQAGAVDRALFTPDFNAYLSDERLAGAAERLAPFGAPERVEVLRTRERGGMEVSSCRLHFASGTLRTSMYRHPDGSIAQFFVEAP